MSRQAIQDSVDVSVDAVADLSTLINDVRVANGTRVWVSGAGVTHGLWCLDQTSALAVDGLTVVATLSGVGRWIFFGASGGAAAGANIQANTEALLSAVGVSALKDGAIGYVGNPLGGVGQSQGSRWTLTTQVAGAPALVAHEVIASAAAGRVWQRDTLFVNERWVQQATWFVDAVGGNDENDGLTNVTALQSYTEFIRRAPFLYVPTTVNVLSTLPDTDNLVHDLGNRWHQGLSVSQPNLTIVGLVTLGAASEVLASTDEAGNNAPTINIGAAFAIGDIIQATDGANPGSTAVVVADLGGFTFRTSPWRSVAAARVAPPAPANHVAVRSIPTVNAAGVRLVTTSATFAVTYQSLNIKELWTNNGPTLCQAVTCKFGGAQNIQPQAGCTINFSGCAFTTTGAIGPQLGGARTFWSLCGIVAPNNTMLIGGHGFGAFFNTVLQNGRIDVGNINNVGGIFVCSSLGIYGVAGGTTLRIQDGAIGRIQGTLYGTDPGGGATGTDVREGGHLYVNANVTPTLAAGTELILDGNGTANAPPPLATGVIPAAVALTTWAQWVAAPFTRNVMSYFTGASITNHV